MKNRALAKHKVQRPAYYIRSLHQIATALFMEETKDFGVTHAQVAALSAIRENPGLDQRTLTQVIDFDAATVGGVLDRLEKRGMVVRSVSSTDRRVWKLNLTPAGIAMENQLKKPASVALTRLMSPLPAKDREKFVAMLIKIVATHRQSAADE